MRAIVAVAIFASGCATEQSATRREPTREEFATARAWLTDLRATAPRDSYVVHAVIAMTEPRSGRTLDGRGVVAVDPGRALRMILLGPGGVTALDVWVTASAWRFAVPSLETVRRGAASDEARGLPIGFFRGWFLAPLDGYLLTANGRATDGEVLLRRGEAVTSVYYATRADRLALRTVRREHDAEERLDWTCVSLAPRAGDHGVYANASGLRVQIDVESVGDEKPEPASFIDPDAPGGVK